MAGVSTATVSRVLNEPERVSAKTRSRVEAAVAHFDYTPHFGGRALASNRTNTVGAVIPTMENAIFARGLQALQEALAADGVTLVVATSNYDPEREAEQIRVLLGRGVDGLVLIGEARDPALYEMLERRGVPFVLVWSWRPGLPVALRRLRQPGRGARHGRTGARSRAPAHRHDRRRHPGQRPGRRPGRRRARLAGGARLAAGRIEPDRDALSSGSRRAGGATASGGNAPPDGDRVRQRRARRRRADGGPRPRPEGADRSLRDRFRRYRPCPCARSVRSPPCMCPIDGWARPRRNYCFGFAPGKAKRPTSSSRRRWWSAARWPLRESDGRERQRRTSVVGCRRMGGGAPIPGKRQCGARRPRGKYIGNGEAR